MIKKLLIALTVIILLGVGYFLLAPLFITTKIDEALPLVPTQNSTLGITSQPQQTGPATIIGTPGHAASGQVKILSDGTDSYIRYENFKTINGPDIYVYLAKDLDAQDFVNIGKVKATEGNVNYKIPTGVTVSDYKYVMIWCKAFGVLFNYADITDL